MWLYQVNITEVIDRVLHPERFEQEKKYVLYAIYFMQRYVLYAIYFMLRASTIIRHLFIIFHCYLIRHFLVSVYSYWSCDVHMCPCALQYGWNSHGNSFKDKHIVKQHSRYTSHSGGHHAVYTHCSHTETPTMANATVNIVQVNFIHSETGKMPAHQKRKYQDQVHM